VLSRQAQVQNVKVSVLLAYDNQPAHTLTMEVDPTDFELTMDTVALTAHLLTDGKVIALGRRDD
jgi:hypothetical protein